ncbi:hypothetical protein L5G28_14945 [Gordonia sp. HY285]|uniref:Uncharacterized protein n=1 Tax=Gordonia liuliyuniae TaxID=2911517 RepID=A0ABS9IVA1_9ACTN|nr:hypothetical protein [Gordonia liuliyuniae]MCF8589488.1 hypothetical protein [Gordonia liuliyuniae]MCF8611444.1 hypothetical protein [Gordonia liuliyuniae]
MNIVPGAVLYLSSGGGSAAYRVAAVRHYPVDFVELVPRDGGKRVGMALSKVSSILQHTP